MKTASGYTFHRAIVLCNPASTQAAQSKQRIAELQQVFGAGNVLQLELVPHNDAANRALLLDHSRYLGPRTLLCVAAGDGTVGMVIERIVQDSAFSEKARQTPILPLWGGNANDLAHMLNGSAARNRLRSVLEQGEVVAVHPLACRLTAPGSAGMVRIAACYVSFGATALAAARLNEAGVRRHWLYRFGGGRFLAEFVAGLGALLKAPSFTLEEQGMQKKVYERTFMNGSRFAGVERLPFKLTDDAFLQHTLEKKRMLEALSRMWEATRRQLVARFRNKRCAFTVTQDVMAQFDGEPVLIAAGTYVQIYKSPQPFYALSLLLKNAPPA